MFFDHIFSLFDLDDVKNILTGLTVKGIKNIMNLIGTPTEDLTTLEWIDIEGVHYLTRAKTKLLKSIQSWICWESAKGLSLLVCSHSTFMMIFC